MSLDSARAHFQSRSRALFRAECRVERKVSDGTFDPITGEIGDPETESIYEGACNVREMKWEGTDVGIAGPATEEVRLQRAEIWLPHDTPILEDDVLTVTAAEHDADIVGQRYRITDIFLDSWQISRRAIGEKVTRGLEGW